MPSNNLQKKNLYKWLTKSVVMLLVVAIFATPFAGFVSQARAQTNTDDSNLPIPPIPPTTIPPATPAVTTPTTATTPGATSATTPPSISQNQNQPSVTVDDKNCSWDKTTWSTCFSDVIYIFTVGLMSILAYIGGYIFDIGVQLTLNSTTFSQDFITTTWTTVRDFANMMFIFMLVYIAIMVIFKADSTGTRRTLAAVIIVALLINFSFLFSRLVIDAGNILAIQFYNGINAPPLAVTAQTSTIAGAANAVTNSSTKDLTAGIMQLIGVQSLLSSNSFSAAFQSNHDFVTNLIVFSFIYIAVGIILAILAFIFTMVGIKFLVRIVVLWLAIIASPLALVAGALGSISGPAKSLFKRWYSTLIQYSFYPAVFLFLFWIVNQFALQLGNGSLLNNAFSPGSLGVGTTGAPATSGAYLIPIAAVVSGICIKLGLLVILLVVAMKASDAIANTGVKAVDSLGSKAGHKLTDWSKNSAITSGNWIARRPAVAGGLLYRNTVAKGAGAGAKALAGTRFGNTTAGYTLRKKVLEPVADSKLGGVRSFTQFRKDQDIKKKEVTGNLRTIQNKKEVAELGRLDTAKEAPRLAELKAKEDTYKEWEKADREFRRQQTIQQKVKDDTERDSPELVKRAKKEDKLADTNRQIAEIETERQAKGVLDPVDAGRLAILTAGKATLEADPLIRTTLTAENKTAVEKFKTAEKVLSKTPPPAVPNLSAGENAELVKLKENAQKATIPKTEINNFSKAEVEAALTKDDIEKIIKHVNEPLMKKIEESDKYSDKDKADLRMKWHNESDDAPLQKAQKQIDLLKKLHEDLKKISTELEIKEVSANTTGGVTITSGSVEDMLTGIKNKMGEIAGSTTLSPGEKITAREQTRDIKNALTKLNDERGKIPPNPIEKRAFGQFKTK